jgi:hypothetical protein
VCFLSFACNRAKDDGRNSYATYSR